MQKNQSTEELKKYLLSLSNLRCKNGRINGNIHKILDSTIKDRLYQLYPGYTLSMAIYCIVNDILSQPTCIICQKIVTYLRDDKTFAPTCSVACSRKDPQTKLKRDATNIARYGSKHVLHNTSIKEKVKNTNIKKYGAPIASLADSVKQRISTSLKNTYGFKKSSIVEKKHKTMHERYNGKHASSDPAVISKKLATNQQRYQKNYGFQSASVKSKIKKTILDRYGVDHPSRIQHVIAANNSRLRCQSQEADERFLSKISSLATTSMTAIEIANLIGMSESYVRSKLKKHNIAYQQSTDHRSESEIELVNYIGSIGIENIIENDRELLNGKEIDIYLPDYKLGIEINGAYWHSEKFNKNKNYHLSKTLLAEQNGIQLLHIFDTEWKNQIQRSIWKSIIKSKLKLNERIHARKCQIGSLTTNVARQFFSQNHLQGYAGGQIKIGLFYNDVLVMACILGKSRFSKIATLELVRSASLQGVTVVGGLSKMLAIIDDDILSYADRRYSNGNAYKETGFSFVKNTSPGYFYLENGQLVSRMKFQKHKISKILSIFDPTKTEKENMELNNMYPIWDCGHKLYLKKKNPAQCLK
jgi:hypothetical protein